MNKKDFSKACLSQSLIELLRDNEYEDISIQDVVDKAGFSRNTYYRNFKNMDEVLDYYLDSFVDKFISDSKLNDFATGSDEYFDILAKHFADKYTVELYVMLLQRGLIEHVSKQFIKRFFNKILPDQDDVFYYFIIGGMFVIFMERLRNRIPMDKEELIKKIKHTIRQITTNYQKYPDEEK